MSKKPTIYDINISSDDNSPIGELSKLTTTAKDNLVDAINEINAKLDKLQNAVKYKGRADAAGDLPADNNEVGDTYFVGPASGSSFAMYVWNGTAWNHVGNPGTISYNSLGNKPQINGVELSGNKSLQQLGIRTAITDITGILTNLATTNKSTLVRAVNELKSDKLDADDLVPATDAEIDSLF